MPLLIIEGVDRTDDSATENYESDFSLDDRIPTVSIDMIDADPDNPLEIMQELVLIDDSSTALTNPTQNILINPLLSIGSLGLNTYQTNTLTGATFSGGPPLQISLNNASYSTLDPTQPPYAVNFAGIQQIDIEITSGMAYTFSFYASTISLTGASVFASIGFYSAGGTEVNAVYTSQTMSYAPGQSRFSFDATAPLGSLYAVVIVGIQTSNATNSGSASFSSLQFEAQTFAARGISYPTPDCNVSATGCILLPDGTTVRQTRIFAGVIIETTPDPDRIGIPIGRGDYPPRPIVTIVCRGPAYLLESKFVNGVFSGQDSTILKSVFADLLPNQIDTTHVVPGVTIGTSSSPDASQDSGGRFSDDETLLEFSQAFANLSGYNTYTDNYYRFHYEPFGYIIADYALSDTPDNIITFGYQEWINPVDGTQIGNRVTVHGGPFTAAYEETQTVPGTIQTNAQGYPCITLTQTGPVEVLSVKVNGTEQTKGIYGNSKTTFATYQVLVDFANQQLVFNTGYLSSGQSIYAQYVYNGQIKEQVLDLQSIAKYKRRNRDGIFDRKVNDTGITTSAAALQRGIAELAQYAYGLNAPTFKTFVPLIPGQTVHITSAQDNYFKQPFLVQSVKTTIADGIVEYEVTCGADIPVFSRSVKHLHKATQRTKRLATAPYTSINLIARESITYGGDFIIVTAQSKTIWDYGASDARYGYASYASTYTPLSGGGSSQYGNGTSFYGSAVYN